MNDYYREVSKVMRDIGFGIIGCGMIASYHADAIAGITGAKLVGACDTNRQSLRSFCEKRAIESFESVDQLLQSEKIDVVCICLPSGLHYETVITCVKHKKHVVVEKPMALNVQQCDDIIRVADENGVYVTVISQLRYTDSMTKLKAAVDNKLLGRITVADIDMKYYRNKEYYMQSNWRGTWQLDGGGALMNQGIHGIDLLQYIMGKVISVQAASRTLLHDIETEDTLVAILEFENGAIGTVQATTSVYPGFERKLSICGTEGTIVLCEDSIEIWNLKNKEMQEEHPNMLSDRRNGKLETGSRPDGMDSTLHQKQLADFVQCIRQGKRPFVDSLEGRKAVAIICAIYEAAKTGKKVSIN